MFKSPDTDTVIRRIIERRLRLGGGDCQIGVRSAAKDAIHELGLEESMSGRPTEHMPMFEGHICNCNPIFPHAVEEARSLGCGLLE